MADTAVLAGVALGGALRRSLPPLLQQERHYLEKVKSRNAAEDLKKVAKRLWEPPNASGRAPRADDVVISAS